MKKITDLTLYDALKYKHSIGADELRIASIVRKLNHEEFTIAENEFVAAGIWYEICDESKRSDQIFESLP